MPSWSEGYLDIHHINTGKGDATFFIFPDGTTFLLDAGAVIRERPLHYDSPQKPDASRRPGEWISRYIQEVHPRSEEGVIDYAAITHFHGDHMGSYSNELPLSASGDYRLTGITDVGEQFSIRTMIDRNWPDYNDSSLLRNDMMVNYQAFLQYQIEQQNMNVQRFVAGSEDQVNLMYSKKDFPEFSFRNIAANGYVWTGTGTEVRSRFPDEDLPGENNRSLAFRIDYGSFVYFSGGDLAGTLSSDSFRWRDMESALAWVVGPVDVHTLNHHGFHDSANTFFLSVLQPRVHILSVYAASHPSPDVMRRLMSEKSYFGPRDIFLTNGLWEGRKQNMIDLFGEKEYDWLTSQMGETASSQGHVAIRVGPGGESYKIFVLDDSDENYRIVSVHGKYEARGGLVGK